MAFPSSNPVPVALFDQAMVCVFATVNAKKRLTKDVINFLRESGLQVIACTEKTTENYYNIDFTLPAAIIMGSEENGISSEYLKMADSKAKIPLMGEIDSLNVSVAGGIIMFEALKQRTIK